MYSPSRIGVSFHKPRTPLSARSNSRRSTIQREVDENKNTSVKKKVAQQIIKATLSPRSPLATMNVADVNHHLNDQKNSPAMITASNMKKHNRIMKSIRSPSASSGTNNGTSTMTKALDIASSTKINEREESPVRLAKNTKRNSSVKKSLRRYDADDDANRVKEGAFISPRNHQNQDTQNNHYHHQESSESTPLSVYSEISQSDNCPSSVTSSVYMKYSQGTHFLSPFIFQSNIAFY